MRRFQIELTSQELDRKTLEFVLRNIVRAESFRIEEAAPSTAARSLADPAESAIQTLVQSHGGAKLATIVADGTRQGLLENEVRAAVRRMLRRGDLVKVRHGHLALRDTPSPGPSGRLRIIQTTS